MLFESFLYTPLRLANKPKDMTNFFSGKVFSQATIVGRDFDYMKKLMGKVAVKDNIIKLNHLRLGKQQRFLKYKTSFEVLYITLKLVRIARLLNGGYMNYEGEKILFRLYEFAV